MAELDPDTIKFSEFETLNTVTQNTYAVGVHNGDNVNFSMNSIGVFVNKSQVFSELADALNPSGRTVIQALVSALSQNYHTYSTNEQVVGEWIDGLPIYEQTFVFTTPITITASTWTTLTEVVLTGDEDIIVKTEVYSDTDKAVKTGYGKNDNGDFKYYDETAITIDQVTIQYTKVVTP